ncbi:hypothetical protein I549_3083 [Mycobacterium avium subsp. avium 2285 (R)]|nr:hypothetical protein I549_3083 [Mycobacterium avium subsp. avium 2285 (R)]
MRVGQPDVAERSAECHGRSGRDVAAMTATARERLGWHHLPSMPDRRRVVACR